MATAAYVEITPLPDTAPKGTEFIPGFSAVEAKAHLDQYMQVATAAINAIDPRRLMFSIPLAGGLVPWALVKRAMPDYPFELASISFVAKDDSKPLVNPRRHPYAMSEIMNPNGADKIIMLDDVADSLWTMIEAQRLGAERGIPELKMYATTRKTSTAQHHMLGYYPPAFGVDEAGADLWVLNSNGMDSNKLPKSLLEGKLAQITVMERMSATPLTGTPEDPDEYLAFMERNTLFPNLYADPIFMMLMNMERMTTADKFAYLTSDPQLVLGL